MNEEMNRPRRERLGRPPLALVAVVACVLLAVAGWSAVWYEGTRRADAMIGDWLAAQADSGRIYDCAERRIGGYPFRVQISCAGPRIEIAEGPHPFAFRARALRAVAMVWNLEHLIVEIDGPVTLEMTAADDDGVRLDADWTALRASLRAPGGRVTRFDVAGDGVTLTHSGVSGTFSAERLELHQRMEGGQADDAVDLAVRLEDFAAELPGLEATPAADLSLRGRLHAMPRRIPQDWRGFLRQWHADSGRLYIDDLRAAQGDTVIQASGRLEPDGRGRPAGEITVRIAGPDVRTPGVEGAFGGLIPLMSAALRLVGRSDEIDGRTAVAGDLVLRDGSLFLGAIPIARLPDVF